MTVIQMRREEDDPAELLTADQWKIAEEAERGNRHCMRGMAEIYESLWHRSRLPEAGGKTLSVKPERLFRLALQWRVRAAEKGDRESMRWLSVYMVRYGEEFDLTVEQWGGRSALEWQEAAAEAGDRYAMKWMGDICADPRRPEFDQAAAQGWYERSAEAGCIYAMDELGNRWSGGIGCTADRQKAIHWYRTAAETIPCWRSLSGVEIRMCMDDVVKAADRMMEEKLSREEREWILSFVELSLKLADRIAISGDLTRSLRKTRLQLLNR